MAEYTLYGKRKICYTEPNDFMDIQGIGSDPLYKRYDSVYSVVEKYISPEHRDFLAHPIYSSKEDKIVWYVKEWTDAPMAYHDLTDLEKERYEAVKNETVSEYRKVCDSLSGEDRQILAGAIKYIDDDFLFCFDDKVVLIAWGMKADSKRHDVRGSILYDLQLQEKYKIRFIPGEQGILKDKLSGSISRIAGAVLTKNDIPEIIANEGYIFKGWEPEPIGMAVNQPMTFKALYDRCPAPAPDPEPKNVPEPEFEQNHVTEQSPEPVDIPLPEPQKYVTCRFVSGDYGHIDGRTSFTVPQGYLISDSDIPEVKPIRGYRFIGWNENPSGKILDEDTEFVARYEHREPWYRRIWLWFIGSGCLKWLLWILLSLLILIALLCLLKGCDGIDWCNRVKPADKIETTDGRIIDDNGPIKGIVGDDGKLPDSPVVAPIIGDDGQMPPIIENPGAPDIIGNRLNIYFENADVDLDAFAVSLSEAYPSGVCQIIGGDRNIPMLQILIPENMRDAIRESLPGKLPDYNFFVVDEAIFTINGQSGGAVENVGWHLQAINLREAWSVTKGSRDIIIGIVDDGIDAGHDLLKRKIVKPYNVFTQDNRLSTGEGHGTHVAGLAAGSDRMFDEGISGVAPKCRIMPVQVFDNGLCTFSSLTSGIMYAIHKGANVVNVSVGPDFSGLDILPIADQNQIARTQFKNEERVWRRVIEVAEEHNAIIVFAAGNDNILASISPSNRTDFTVNVAAVDMSIRGTDFTNYGSGSNISAPGKDIASSVPVNQYAVYDGTSMAAPIVAGTVALMKSLDEDISVSDVLAILQSTGRPVSDDVPPMVQADAALVALKTGNIPSGPGDVTGPSEDDDVTGDGGSAGKDSGQQDDSWQEDVPSGPDAPAEISSPDDHDPGNGTDYDAIRRLIEEYKKKIEELEKLLPENQ